MNGFIVDTAPVTSGEPVRFIRCLPLVLREEVNWHDPFVWSDVRRNFSNDRGDPGGKTMCGIIQREYDHFRKTRRLPTRDVRLIEEWEGHTIYYEWYWKPNCSGLVYGLDLTFFDASVNMGTTEAIRLLQRTLDVPPDGLWGPKTAEAVALTPAASAVILSFSLYRLEAYRLMSAFHIFGHVWTSRTNRIEKASLEMLNERLLSNSGGTTSPPTCGESGSSQGTPG
jgi:lysozyme family protein